MNFFLTGFKEKKTRAGIHLIRDYWDDFGFKTLYTMYYLDDNLNEMEIGYLKIGQKSMMRGYVNLSDNFEELDDTYFSVGLNTDYYINISKLGKTLRENILSSLNDIAFSTENFEKAKDELVTQRSLFRDISPIIIKNQFKRIAHGGVPLSPYEFSYVIKMSKSENNMLSFSVVPDSLPPTNVHAIIGSNGTGKTTTLRGIIEDYISQSSELNIQFSNVIFISFSMFDQSFDFCKSIADKEIRFSYIGACNDRGSNKSHKDMTEDFLSSIITLIRTKKIDVFLEAISLLESDPNLANYGIGFIVESYLGSEQSTELNRDFKHDLIFIFQKCSSGHKITLLITVKLIELIVEKTLVIFDEPETHLHPPLLSALITCISKVVINANAVAIMATHSPVVLQEIPRSCISILRRSGDYISVFKPKIETFGENISVLTEEIFGLEIRNTGFHTLLKNEIKKYNNYDDVVSAFDGELSLDAKSIIRAYLNQQD